MPIHRTFAAALAASVLVPVASWAQGTYPDRTVTLVVPYAAGGPTDTVARLVAEPMSKALGQQVIIENMGGASGTIGAGQVARADADGYTLMLHTSAQATNDLFYDKLAYGSREAFQPIGGIRLQDVEGPEQEKPGQRSGPTDRMHEQGQ